MILILKLKVVFNQKLMLFKHLLVIDDFWHILRSGFEEQGMIVDHIQRLPHLFSPISLLLLLQLFPNFALESILLLPFLVKFLEQFIMLNQQFLYFIFQSYVKLYRSGTKQSCDFPSKPTPTLSKSLDTHRNRNLHWSAPCREQALR